MRRMVLLSLAVLALLAGTFLVYFTTSDYCVRGQPYLDSLSDFLFMVDAYRRREMRIGPPVLDDGSYERVLRHFRPEGHHEVQRMAAWRLSRWGDKVIPRLAREVDRPVALSRADGSLSAPRQEAVLARPRQEGAVKALGMIGSSSATLLLGDLLQRLEILPEAPGFSRLRAEVIRALGETRNPLAAEPLIRFARGSSRGGPLEGDLLDAIGRTGGGADFLLEALGRTKATEEKYAFLWPLAATQDPRAARVLASFLLHPVSEMRRKSRDAMDQFLGPAAVGPVLDIIEKETDEIVLSTILDCILDDRDARGHPRVVAVVARLLSHPVLGKQARYVLCRLGGSEAVAALMADAPARPVNEALEHLEHLGGAALPIIEPIARSPNPRARMRALDALVGALDPAAAPLVASFSEDPEPEVRRQAREALLTMDKAALLESVLSHLPEHLRPGLRSWYRHIHTWDSEFDDVWVAFTMVHWVGTVLSGLLGLLLVAKALRIFEAYRFGLFIQFLVAEGFLGDFLFLDQGVDAPFSLYLAGTAIHLLLLAGYLFQAKDRLPGETRNRFDRLGGASLWLLTPPLLWFGTPLLARSLRLSFQDASYASAFAVLAGAAAVLVFEQRVLPWHLFARAARVERTVGGLLSAALLGLLASSLFGLSGRLSFEGPADMSVLCLLLVAPLLWMLVCHLHAIDLFRRGAPPMRLPEPPRDRLRMVQDGDRFIVRVHPGGRKWWPMLLGLPFIFLAGGTSGWLAGRGGGAMEMMLALVGGLTGAGVAALFLEALSPRVFIQIRLGHVRCATTLLGFALRGGAWRRNLAFEEAVGRRLARGRGAGSCGAPLADEERSYIEALMAKSKPCGFRRAAAPPRTGPGERPAPAGMLGGCAGRPLALWVVLAILAGGVATAGDKDPGDFTRILEAGPREEWADAARSLTTFRWGIPGNAVASMVKRLDDLPADVRLLVAGGLKEDLRDPRAVAALTRLARDADPRVREKAVDVLLEARAPEALPGLFAVLEPAEPRRAKILEGIRRLFERKAEEAVESLRYATDEEARAAAFRELGALHAQGLVACLADPDPLVRRRAIEALAPLPVAAVGDVLLAASRDSSLDVRKAAVAALTRRAGEPPSVRQEARVPPRVVKPAPQAIGGSTLALFAVLSAALGLALFLWAFRMLQLRRLLRGLPVSKARSVAMGRVALKGTAQPLEGVLMEHPLTGEPCLHHVGADRQDPAAPFLLTDDTGRIVVDPRGAVLLSEDGVIVPGEDVYVMGEVTRAPTEAPGRLGHPIVGKPRVERTLFEKAVHFVIQGLLGGLAGQGKTMMLFSDPRSFFWIWDDAEKPPMSSSRETAVLFGAFVLAGSWVLIFGAAAAALLSQDFSAAVAAALGAAP